MNQWVSWRYIFISFVMTVSFALLPQEDACVRSFVALENNLVCHDAIQKSCVESFVVESVTYDSDVYFDEKEFFYLIGFSSGDEVNAARIVNAVECLGKKNKFSRIKIDFVQHNNTVMLHFAFQSVWTFKKIKIHGVFQRKYVLSQAYIMSRGDQFDRSKHSHSIVKIKELLSQDGYYNNSVTTRFDFDKKTKEVIVHVFVKNGKRFSFGAIAVELSGDDEGVNYQALSSQIKRKLSRKLSSQHYQASLINREAVALKGYLGRRGYLHTDFELAEYRDVDKCCVDLTWKINVHQKRAFVFFGNRFFSKKELLEKILAFGRSAWLLPASLLAEEILAAYKRKGFWKAEVVTQEEKGRSFFVIQEGTRAVISSVEVRNAQGFDPILLQKQCFRKLLRNKQYDFQILDEALRLLARLYLNEGFLSCVVVDHSFIKTEHDNEYTLVVTLDEGKRSYIASVSIEGYPELLQEGPFKKHVQGSQLLFDMSVIDVQKSWLTNHFQGKGYIHARIKPQITMNEHEVHVVWNVDLGEQVRFGKTIIMGSNAALPFSSVLSLLGYQQGAIWDQEKIKQTFKAFKELDVFESINLAPDYTDKNEEKSVVVKLQADDSYEVRLRAGLELQHVRKYQTFNGLTYKIGGTTLMRNPFNSGDVARLDLDFARSHREVIARYRRPLFLTMPLMGTFRLYSMSYDQPGFVGSVNDIYTLMQNGFSYGIERKTTFCKLGITIGYEGMTTKIKDPIMQESLIRAINFKPQLVDQMVPFFFVEPTVMLEYLDNGLNPTSGFLTLFSLKSMIPFQKKYKDTLFFKMLFEQSFFIPLGSVVAAFRLRFGHIFYRELSAIMPSERFYLGGSHSLRGYEADLAPPLGVFVDEETEEHIVPRGGRSMCNANIELRFPIFKKMGGVVFQDLGMLSSDRFADFTPNNILAATGFGGRFHTPLGPLRFDIGWKWRRESKFERSYAWFLTFGQAF